MPENHFKKIAGELQVSERQVEATVQLLDEGATVPFIARYRKEVTGTLDEVAIAAIRDRIEQLRDLDKRRESILKSLKDQEKLTPELEAQVLAAQTMAVLEDIYLPFKPKRRTRATIAREKGLEPLAQTLFEQANIDLHTEAAAFVCEEKEVKDTEEALAGARDIIAEWVNENPEARASIRNLAVGKPADGQAEMYSYGVQFIDLDPVHYTLLQNMTYEALLADRGKIV